MKSSQVTEVEKKVQEVYRFRRQDQMHSFEEYMGFVNQASESLAPTINRMSPIVRDVAAGTRRPSRRAYRPAHKFSEELNALTGEGIIPTEVAKSLLDARSVRDRIAHGADGVSLGTVDDPWAFCRQGIRESESPALRLPRRGGMKVASSR
jgi:hypothetical protein